jgi:hypothetical protein
MLRLAEGTPPSAGHAILPHVKEKASQGVRFTLAAAALFPHLCFGCLFGILAQTGFKACARASFFDIIVRPLSVFPKSNSPFLIEAARLRVMGGCFMKMCHSDVVPGDWSSSAEYWLCITSLAPRPPLHPHSLCSML